MGLETIVAGLSAIVGVVGGVMQASAASSAAAAQKEANAVASAQQQITSAESRRAKIREARIRQAQILAASENQGTSGSSGEIGAVGALSTNLSGLISSSLGEAKANSAINSHLQTAQNFTDRANTIGAWTDTIQSGLSGFNSVFDKKERQQLL